jgi:hypothetical protein
MGRWVRNYGNMCGGGRSEVIVIYQYQKRSCCFVDYNAFHVGCTEAICCRNMASAVTVSSISILFKLMLIIIIIIKYFVTFNIEMVL